MRKPFISVCIPTYKKADYVKRLLTSVTEQQFKDIEVVVTDNSEDHAVEEVVQGFMDRLPLRYFRNEPPVGMGGNFNRCLTLARGEWVKIIHDDDWLASPHALEKFAEAARKSTSKFIFSACNNVPVQGPIHREQLEPWKKELLEDSPLNLFYLNVIGHPSTVMHYNDPAILYDPQFRWLSDIDFYIRYLLAHPGFSYIDESLINIGVDENQMSNRYYKNGKVEIPEYFTLLSHFPSSLMLEKQYVFGLVWTMVKRYRIKNAEDIRSFGYEGRLPDRLQQLINYQRKIPRIILKQTPWSAFFMKKAFQKIRTT